MRNVTLICFFFKYQTRPIVVSQQDRLFATKRIRRLPSLKDEKPKSKYDNIIRKVIEQKRRLKKKSTPSQTTKVVSKSKPITIAPSGTDKSIFGTASFEALKLRAEILEALKTNNFNTPTWIQVQCIQ